MFSNGTINAVRIAALTKRPFSLGEKSHYFSENLKMFCIGLYPVKSESAYRARSAQPLATSFAGDAVNEAVGGWISAKSSAIHSVATERKTLRAKLCCAA